MSLKQLAVKELGLSSLEPAGIRLDNTGTKLPPQGFSRTKIIRCGKMLEIYNFEIPIRYGQKGGTKKNSKRKSPRHKEHRERSIVRATNTIRRLTHLNFNQNDMFLSLTFNNHQSFNINNLSECLPYYQKFIRKLRQKYPKLLFITVPEFQKRGAVHYHLICNIPLINQDELALLWPHGFSAPRAIRNTTHLALYLCKYLSKEFADARKHGHRLFYSSRGLNKPEIFYGPAAEAVGERIKTNDFYAIEYRNQYDTARNGSINYVQYLKK